jgi:hypothetical protein
MIVRFGGVGYSGICHAGANIEVCLGGVALRAFGADRGGHCARVPLFAYGTKAAVTPAGRGENVLEMIRQGHAAFPPDHMLSDSSAKTTRDKLAYR